MKPLQVIDCLHRELPVLPMMDFSHCGLFIEQARDTEYKFREIRAPFNMQIVGMALAPLAQSLRFDPYPTFFEQLGFPVQIAFVFSNLPNLTGLPYVVRRDRTFGNVDCPVLVNDDGEIAPERPLADRTQFDLLVGRWFFFALQCFGILQNSSKVRLEDVPLDLSRRERKVRARRHLPLEYLMLREVAHG